MQNVNVKEEENSTSLPDNGNVESLDDLDADMKHDSSIPQKQIRTTASNIVKFNVGGVPFITTLRTASKSGYLRGLLSGKFVVDVDSENRYFIDRNGDYFKYLLDYMRSGYCEIPLKFAQCVKIESEYFLIEDFYMKVFNRKPIRIIIEDVYHSPGLFTTSNSKWELRVNGMIVEGNKQGIASLGIPGLQASNFSQYKTIKRAANLAMYLITKCGYHQLNDRLTVPKDGAYSPYGQGRCILLQNTVFYYSFQL